MTALRDYLDNRLGVGRGSTEREYFCFACIDRLGSESSKRKLRINVSKGKAFCPRCGYSASTAERLLRDMNSGRLTLTEMALLREEGRPPEESIDIAARMLLAKPAADAARKLNPVPLPPESFPLTAGQSWTDNPKAAQALAYLEKRRISFETAVQFDIRYCAYGHFGGYLIFPVTMYGVHVYWTNRYAGDRPWYIPEDKFNKSLNQRNQEGDYGKSDVLLGFDRVVGQPVVEVGEGPFDAMAVPWGVAMMGKRPSAAQIALLIELAKHGTREFIISVDPDAIREAEMLGMALRDVVDRVTFLPLNHGDPSSRQDEMGALMDARVSERSLLDRVALRMSGEK